MPDLTQAADLRHHAHYLNKRGPFYLACTEWNFAWTEDEYRQAVKGWKDGRPIWEVAETVGRPVKELFLLYLDLADRGVIQERPGKIYGFS